MSTIGDDLLRQGGELRADGTPFGPRIEALVVYNSNPVAVAPDSTRVARGFAREDLFTVVLEHFMTDTADLADYVLPATTQLEHLDVHTSYGHTYAMINEPAIAPLGEAKPNTQVFRELAARMGFDDAVLRRRRRGAGADRVPPGGGGRRRFRGAARAGLGQARHRRGAVRRRRLSDARPARPASTSPASAFPITSPTTNRRPAPPSSRAASRSR